MDIIQYQKKAAYHETDQMGIIHHSNYIKWLEEARVYFLEAIGYPYAKLEAAGVVCPVVSVSCKYHHPLRFDDVVAIGVTVESYNGVTLKLAYQMIDLSTHEVCTTAWSEHCFLADGKVTILRRVNKGLDATLRSLKPREEDGADG